MTAPLYMYLMRSVDSPVSDDAIIDTFASCMGQPWPAAREHVGNYFGKNREQLDEYGHNLAAAI